MPLQTFYFPSPFRSACAAMLAAGLLASCGSGSSSGTSGGAQSPGPAAEVQPTTLALLAGDTGGPGNLDGLATAEARVYSIGGAAADAAGNLYFTESSDQTLRKLSVDGIVSTIAGSHGDTGTADGNGAAARFGEPAGIVTDSQGNLYIADRVNATIRKVTPSGAVTTLAGKPGARLEIVDGSAAAARFLNPGALAIDAAGRLYAGDSSAIRRIGADGSVVTVAGSGESGDLDGPAASARFGGVAGMVFDGAGNLYFTDASHTVRVLTADGMVRKLAGAAQMAGMTDGRGTQARFNAPAGISIGKDGLLYVADRMNQRIRRVSPDGEVTTVAGNGKTGAQDGAGAAAQFDHPQALATNAAGKLIVGERGTLRSVDGAAAVSTVAGKARQRVSVDGKGSAARFAAPRGLALDASGNAYMADGRSLRKVSPDGTVVTLAGQSDAPAAIVDGTGSEARFALPVAVAVAPDGTIYVAEANDMGVNCFCISPHDHVIRKVTPAGVVTTIAGTPGVFGQADGTGAAASFYFITAMAADANGNLFVKERYGSVIRKLTPAGVVTSIPLAAAVEIAAMTVDADGSIVAAGAGKVLRISQGGSISELAGAGSGLGYELNGIAVDKAGNIYVADTSNHLLRKITPEGLVSVPVGAPKRQGIRLGTLPGNLSSPTAIAVRENGGLYIVSESALLRAY